MLLSKMFYGHAMFIGGRLQNSRFRKAGSAVSVNLEGEAREPHTPAGRVRRENDCRLSIPRIRSKEGLYNVTEVTEIA